MKLQDLIPASGLPRSGNPEGCCEHWFGQDGPDDYRRHGGHPVYGETDIVYRYNALGYRCPDFGQHTEDAIKILCVGCSWVFGVGVHESAIFHERFAARLGQELGTPVIDWNLGVAGVSNDCIVRLLHLAVPALDPDVVLVFFTHAGRRDYVTAHDRHIKYSPTWTAADPVSREISTHFAALSSSYDDQLNLFRNYKSAQCLLKDRPWCCSFVKRDQIDGIAAHIDQARLARPHTWLDRARDHAHPGPVTHQNIYEGFWTTFAESGDLDGLRRRLRVRKGEVAT